MVKFHKDENQHVNQFLGQKSTCTKFYEHNQFYEEKNLCKIFTKKKSTCNKFDEQKSTRDKFHE